MKSLQIYSNKKLEQEQNYESFQLNLILFRLKDLKAPF